jgi:hypothetical protein
MKGSGMEHNTIRGSCLCGQVKFELTPPFLFFQYCHCSRCRKISGSAHAANIFVVKEQFEWTSGEDLVRRYELPGAKYFCTGFCSVCGSRLPWRSRNGEFVLVPAGSLDQDPGARPERNIYWSSRAPWYVDVSHLPTFDEKP